MQKQKPKGRSKLNTSDHCPIKKLKPHKNGQFSEFNFDLDFSKIKIPQINPEHFKFEFFPSSKSSANPVKNINRQSIEIIYSMTEKQWDIVMKAMNLAKEKYSLRTSKLALVNICKKFIEHIEKK